MNIVRSRPEAATSARTMHGRALAAIVLTVRDADGQVVRTLREWSVEEPRRFATDHIVERQEDAPGARLSQGSLEGSNVSALQLTTELIEIQRAYAAYLNTMKIYSELGKKAREIGQIG